MHKLKRPTNKQMKKLLVPIITLLLASVLESCGRNIFKQIEIENPKQFKEEVIKELTNKINPKDTLYLTTSRMLGICGNDERYDGVTTPEEKLEELKYIKENPYYIDENKDYEKQYNFNDKIIITGTAFDNEFTYGNLKFNNESLKIKKQVYDIQYTSVKKDTVVVSVFDFNNNQTAIRFKMALNNAKWKLVK